MPAPRSLAVMLAALGPLAGTPQDPAPQPAPTHVARDIEGFTVWVDVSLSADQPELLRATLRELEHQLYAIGRAVPPAALAKLRQCPIWVQSRSKTLCMAYHPSARWLVDNGFDPRLERAVELGDPATFLAWTRIQPWMVLHELAHAWHHRELGFAHDGIRAAFERARGDPRWSKVLDHAGREVTPYASTDEKEFFAELSEALFGTNDFYPFVRGELRVHDPEAHALVCAVWGVAP